jgi:ABC-type glycerol-3-phosphate transport system permease component
VLRAAAALSYVTNRAARAHDAAQRLGGVRRGRAGGAVLRRPALRALLPGDDLFANIATAIEQQNICLALWNSLVVSGITTVATMLFCTLAGFSFGKMRFPGRNLLFGITLIMAGASRADRATPT